MTHEELIDCGCELMTAEDHNGEIKTGYWLGGTFCGETEESAAEAILG